jgi:putative peptidoglycan lipid II flippase
VRIIPIATLAGDLVALAVLSALARRNLSTSLAPNLDRPEPVLRILRLVRLETIGTVITRINPLVDQLMAGLAGVVGGGTLVRYASDVASLPNSLLQATLFPALLTRLAREADAPSRFASTVRRVLVAVVALLAVVTALLGLVRRPLCTLLFSHGAMDAGGVTRIADILPWALAGVAPFGVLLVLARAHVARQNSRIMPAMGLLNAALNATLNLLFVGKLGLSGIAFSTSVTYLVVATVFWARLARTARA